MFQDVTGIGILER